MALAARSIAKRVVFSRAFVRCISAVPKVTPYAVPKCVGPARFFSSKAEEVVVDAMPAGTDEETREFKAETKKLLDIVARSLYSDKKIFIRELISNASDALEKMRHHQMTHGAGGAERTLEVKVFVDNVTNTLTIKDTGIGMTRQELVDNLGTVARSGSEEFVRELSSGKTSDAAQNIIGRFGVGFYSAFIVADRVEVTTRAPGADAPGLHWVSDGTGSYTIKRIDDAPFGTTIKLHLRKDCAEFASKSTVENIIKKYSNFVSFPIMVGDKRVNVIEPLWLKSKGDVTKEQHTEFYRFIANAWDEPLYTLHYTADSPVQIRALLYFPSNHTEFKFSAGKLDPGVNLYSRKVLIQAKAKGLLPEFLRFVKGVVDSEDLPLNLSREFAQDDAIIMKLNTVLTRRVLRHLADEAKNDAVKYDKWFKEFGNFIKEGLCTPESAPFKDDLANLLRFESSSTEAGKTTSLAEYKERMISEQKDIFYVVGPSRALALSSPYYESFKEKGIEVLICTHPVDEFVMTHLGSFKEHTITSVESKDAVKKDEDKPKDTAKAAELKPLTEWLQTTLGSKVKEVTVGDRSHSVPALIVGHMSASHSRLMRVIDPSSTTGLEGHVLEINPSSPIITRLGEIRQSDPEFAKTVAFQIFDNALIAAGLLDDARPMLGRLNTLLERAVR